jgi:hypothetical protein
MTLPRNRGVFYREPKAFLPHLREKTTYRIGTKTVCTTASSTDLHHATFNVARARCTCPLTRRKPCERSCIANVATCSHDIAH